MIRVEFLRNYPAEVTPTENLVYPEGWRGKVHKDVAEDAISIGAAKSLEPAKKTENKSSKDGNTSDKKFKHELEPEVMEKLENHLTDYFKSHPDSDPPNMDDINKAIDGKAYAEHRDFVWAKLKEGNENK